MPVELRIAAFGAVLLVVHIIIATQLKNNQYGLKWNMSARDGDVPEPRPATARMIRAQANFLETLPIAIIALLGVVIAGRTSPTTALGGWIWLGARIVYIPLYWLGVPVVRTICWGVSIVGLVMALKPLLVG
jgi:uncharacterized MAPEG superfamily protein